MKIQEEFSALAAASALNKMLKKVYVTVFKTLYFLIPKMDLVYIWYDYRSKFY